MSRVGQLPTDFPALHQQPYKSAVDAIAAHTTSEVRRLAEAAAALDRDHDSLDNILITGRHQMKINNAATAQINDHLNNRR